jgi:ethanolamine ammonia-lyase small subunit
VNLDTIKIIYVRKQDADNKGIEKLIAEYLNKIGKTAKFGSEEQTDQSADAILTYQDRWMWDITMYMLELRIQIRDPASEYAFASGQSYRTSLARKDPEEMVREVIDEIFHVEQSGE